jgi:hypothetical protein
MEQSEIAKLVEAARNLIAVSSCWDGIGIDEAIDLLRAALEPSTIQWKTKMDDGQRFHTLYSAMKAMAWERAKGALRECAAAIGATHGAPADEIYKWETFNAKTEDFIKEIENEGLHE